MRPNVGGLDRTARIVIGIALALVAALAPLDMTWRIAALVVAVIALATATVRFGRVNALLGINTCEPKPGGKA